MIGQTCLQNHCRTLGGTSQQHFFRPTEQLRLLIYYGMDPSHGLFQRVGIQLVFLLSLMVCQVVIPTPCLLSTPSGDRPQWCGWEDYFQARMRRKGAFHVSIEVLITSDVRRTTVFEAMHKQQRGSVPTMRPKRAVCHGVGPTFFVPQTCRKDRNIVIIQRCKPSMSGVLATN